MQRSPKHVPTDIVVLEHEMNGIRKLYEFPTHPSSKYWRLHYDKWRF